MEQRCFVTNSYTFTVQKFISSKVRTHALQQWEARQLFLFKTHTHTDGEREREREFNKKDRMVNNSFHRMFFYLKDWKKIRLDTCVSLTPAVQISSMSLSRLACKHCLLDTLLSSLLHYSSRSRSFTKDS